MTETTTEPGRHQRPDDLAALRKGYAEDTDLGRRRTSLEEAGQAREISLEAFVEREAIMSTGRHYIGLVLATINLILLPLSVLFGFLLTLLINFHQYEPI